MTETEIFSLFQEFYNQHQIPSPFFKGSTVLANQVLTAVTFYMAFSWSIKTY